MMPGMYDVLCGLLSFGIALISSSLWSVWCGSTVIDSFICYGEIRAGMCRTEYLIDWNSLELYKHLKMSWDSNIYTHVHKLKAGVFIHSCVFICLLNFLVFYFNKNYIRVILLSSKKYVRMPCGSHLIIIIH